MKSSFVAIIAATVMNTAAGPVLAHDTTAEANVVAVASASTLEHLPGEESLPELVVQVSPFIPGMGEHWADPVNLPLGPIYCVMNGRVTCMEYMIAQEDFAAGKSFEQLRPWLGGAEQPAIDHMEFNFEPNGHEGYEAPHFDVHMYFVSPDLRMTTRAAMK